MTIADLTKSALHRVGLDLRWHRPAAGRRNALLLASNVRTVVDVGANTGQYGTEIRQAGFGGRIVSFEPLSEAYQELLRASAGDRDWLCLRLALSDRSGPGRLHVAGNLASSSLLMMASAHREAAPDTQVLGVEEVTLCRLDAVDALRSAATPLMLKLDVQGHEVEVVLGAEGILDHVVLLEVELSVCELYRGAPTMLEALTAMAGHGFELVALEPGFHDPRDGRILQFDGLFRSTRTAAS